jgi:hypothetical protein
VAVAAAAAAAAAAAMPPLHFSLIDSQLSWESGCR